MLTHRIVVVVAIFVYVVITIVVVIVVVIIVVLAVVVIDIATVVVLSEAGLVIFSLNAIKVEGCSAFDKNNRPATKNWLSHSPANLVFHSG